jgi:splicing factor 3B subunit 3
VPRWLTAAHHIDFDTMAGADKFGNIYFARLPQDTSDEIEEDPTGGRIKWEQGKLNGAPNKVMDMYKYFSPLLFGIYYSLWIYVV